MRTLDVKTLLSCLDKITCHFTQETISLFKAMFPRRVVSLRSDNIKWLPQVCDFTPIQFFL